MRSCVGGAAPRRRRGSARSRRPASRPATGDVAERRGPRDRARAPVSTIVGAEPPQRPADGLGREVAAARGHRARLHRRAEQARPARSHRRSEVGDRFPAHALLLHAATAKKRAMWDRLLADCNIATMDPAVPGAFGAIEDGAIGIQDGRIVRVGRRIELAGYQAKKVEPLGGAWVTPGPDRLPHPSGLRRQPRGRVRAAARTARAMRRSPAPAAASSRRSRRRARPRSTSWSRQSRPRLRALMRGGVTTVEIKSGYGLDIETELKMLRGGQGARRERDGAGRADPARAPRLPPEIRASGARSSSGSPIDEHDPGRGATQGWRARSTPYCEGIGFTPDEVRDAVRGGGRARPAGQAPRRAAQQSARRRAGGRNIGALSADHLEHVDEAGVGGDGARPEWSRCCCPAPSTRSRETRKPPVDLLRRHGVPMAVATDCNPGTSPVLSPTLMLSMACTLFGLTPEEALAGMTREARQGAGPGGRGRHDQRRQGRRPVRLAGRAGRPSFATGSAMPGPERRIVAGEDA